MHKSVSDDKKLEKQGFTKYVKAGNGIYEKRCDKGPQTISRDQPIKGCDGNSPAPFLPTMAAGKFPRSN